MNFLTDNSYITGTTLEECVENRRKSMQKALDNPKIITCDDFEKSL